MKPWREVVIPHPDVLEGTFQQSEFAADITAVRKGEATREYQDPIAFFSAHLHHRRHGNAANASRAAAQWYRWRASHSIANGLWWRQNAHSIGSLSSHNEKL